MYIYICVVLYRIMKLTKGLCDICSMIIGNDCHLLVRTSNECADVK